MKQLHTLLALTVLALLPTTWLLPHSSFAPQEPKLQEPKTAAPANPGAANPRANPGDAVLAAWLLMANNHEGAMAGLAQQRAESAEVKQFALTMASDHSRMAQQLKPYADGALRSAGTGFDHQALLRDLGKKCLDAETNLLHEKTGAEFDRHYLRMQVVAHAKAAAMTEVFASYASEQLRPILDEGQKTLQAHLEQAKTLCLQLEKAEKAPKTEKPEKVGGDK